MRISAYNTLIKNIRAISLYNISWTYYNTNIGPKSIKRFMFIKLGDIRGKYKFLQHALLSNNYKSIPKQYT